MIVSLARVMDQCGWKVTFVIQQRYQLKMTLLHRIISASGGDWKTTAVSPRSKQHSTADRRIKTEYY